jgi:hypothetical protein
MSAYPCFGLACHIIYSTCWVPTIGVLTLALLKPILLRTRQLSGVSWRCWRFLGVCLPVNCRSCNKVLVYSLSLMHCFGYSLVTSTVCEELDPGAHMGCIRLPFLNRVWHIVLSNSLGSILVPRTRRRLVDIFEKSTFLVCIGWSDPSDPNSQCAKHFMSNLSG